MDVTFERPFGSIDRRTFARDHLDRHMYREAGSVQSAGGLPRRAKAAEPTAARGQAVERLKALVEHRVAFPIQV